MARRICRRSECIIITLSKEAKINEMLIKYINRLSDYLYAVSRFNEKEIIYIVIIKAQNKSYSVLLL